MNDEFKCICCYEKVKKEDIRQMCFKCHEFYLKDSHACELHIRKDVLLEFLSLGIIDDKEISELKMLINGLNNK